MGTRDLSQDGSWLFEEKKIQDASQREIKVEKLVLWSRGDKQ